MALPNVIHGLVSRRPCCRAGEGVVNTAFVVRPFSVDHLRDPTIHVGERELVAKLKRGGGNDTPRRVLVNSTI
jgi:hypothetical protein